MDIVPLTEERLREWDAFCAASDDAWFWHTSVWLEFMRACKPDLNSESFSFMVTHDNVILAVCPLFLETRETRREFSFGGGGLPTPALSNNLDEKSREKILRFIFIHLDALAKEKKVSRAEFRFPFLNPAALSGGRRDWNFLVKFGYLDTSISTQIIEVGRSVEELKRGIRHGHASDIHRAAKSLHGEILGRETITSSAFDAYRETHKRAAGRVTRPRGTFEIQHKLIKSGNAFLAAAKNDAEFVGFSYVLTYKQCAYYASACNDPRFSELPIGHFLQWESIKYLHALGITHYEIGWQRFMPSFAGYWTDKEISISKFMRGFGGKSAPLFRGEKYYDRAYFLEVYRDRVEKNADVISKAANARKDETTA